MLRAVAVSRMLAITVEQSRCVEMNTWPNRLKNLQTKLEKSTEEMADVLGISPRTLGEFTRPEGRDPSEPIQKLVKILEGNLNQHSEQDKTQNPPLIIISSELPLHGKENILTLIDKMEKDAISSGDKFHFISLDPENDIKDLSIVQDKRITPHFFVSEKADGNSNEEKISYFSSIAVRLAVKAIAEKKVSHVVLAADVRKFWPLALAIKYASDNVKISFIRDTTQRSTQEEEDFFNKHGIEIIAISTRQYGRVETIKPDGYGFIKYAKTENGSWVTQDGSVFFSWNHMRKRDDGRTPEVAIQDLTSGDIVNFVIGMNDKGPCATDVVLIERAKTTDNDSEILRIIKAAVMDCIDENNFALVSSVGTRLNVLHNDFKKLLEKHDYKQIKDVFSAHTNVFEYSADGTNAGYNAACVRLR